MLADDLYWLAHDGVTGQPRLHPAATSTGLASALLAELLLARRIELDSGVVRVSDVTPPADPLSHDVLHQIAHEPGEHQVRDWLTFLSRSATEQVAQRLVRAGHLNPQKSRRLLRNTVAYLPTDFAEASRPWAVLSGKLLRKRPLDQHDRCLAALLLATGLSRHLLADAPAHAADHMRRSVADLWPPAAQLMHLTHAAVGAAVMANRK